MELGPRQFERDTSGKGAVLCTWAVYISIQAQTAACGLERKPVDDAIDEVVLAMDEFILANSSLRPTRAMLDEFKRGAVESELSMLRQRGLEKTCRGRDLAQFRNIDPDQLRTGVKTLLSVPREPVMNPCL